MSRRCRCRARAAPSWTGAARARSMRPSSSCGGGRITACQLRTLRIDALEQAVPGLGERLSPLALQLRGDRPLLDLRALELGQQRIRVAAVGRHLAAYLSMIGKRE